MADASRHTHRPSAWLALLLILATLVLAVRALAPPEAVPEHAPESAFSAARAHRVLGHLLGDESPHPVGSVANRAVRDRLLEQLVRLGLEPQIQRTVGCSATRPVCANVENVLAEIQGKTTDALALMAHYDSVPHAPGAADDGAGVATLLEAARLLVRDPIRRNRILLIFTDAEEVGLLGAEAFFSGHPWREHVRAVINLEGAGSGGPSLLLRSTEAAGHLLSAYRATATAPVAFSYSQEVFARMPNDTDFSVAGRAGIRGLDFAFAFEFNHYHTPLDTVANLELSSLQHHGSNLLPLARALAAEDLNRTAPNFAYQTIGQRVWLTWPSAWTLGLALLGLAGLAVPAAGLVRADGGAGRWAGQIAGGAALAFACLGLGLAANFAALWLAGALAGTIVSFPANPWPWRVLMAAAALLPVSLASWWVGQRLTFWPRYLGVWLLLGIFALLLAVAVPLAANLLIVPVLVAAAGATLILLAKWGNHRAAQAAAALVSLAALSYLLLGIAYAMDQTQGLRLAPAIYVNLVLVALGLLPFRASGRLCLILAVALPGSWAWVLQAPLYSQWRPQHVSLYYVLDADNHRAQWWTFSTNPLPARLVEALGGQAGEAPMAPWVRPDAFPVAAAPAVDLPPPSVAVTRAAGRVRIEYRSAGTGDFAQLVLPAAAGVSGLRMAGREVTLSERNGYLAASFFANGGETLVFEFEVEGTGPHQGFLVDGDYRLPEVAASIVVARGSLAVPQHRGDGRLIYRQFSF